TLWARKRIDDLMSQDYQGLQHGNAREDVREAITQLGLEYRLMTQFTSFVAVEEMIVTDGGQPRRIEVPVETPEGVSFKEVFGDGAINGRQIGGQLSLVSRNAMEMVTLAPSGSGSKAKAPSQDKKDE